MTTASLAGLNTYVGAGTVLVAAHDGSVAPDAVTGLYHGDRRLLSRLRVRVTGHRLELLSSTRARADTCVHHLLVVGSDGQRHALLSRTRTILAGLREQIVVRAFDASVVLELRIDVQTDLADLMRLRYRHGPPPPVPYHADGDRLRAVGGDGVGATITAPGATVDAGGSASWTVTVAPRAPRTVELDVRPVSDAAMPDGHPHPQIPTPRRPDGHPDPLSVGGSDRWQRAISTAAGDLAALRMHDTGRGISWVGAGAPWYMALFGRDALLTAYEALVLGPDLALAVLDALARFQGATPDAATGEEPGKVLHELRTGHSGIFGLEPWTPYYGSVDATPLFVLLLAEAFRWGAPPARVRTLLPAARRAVAWCRATARRHPRGYLTYTADPDALANQGWKDSPDAMIHADGRTAAGSIALVEAQAYYWRALRDLAALETALGDPSAAPDLRRQADALRERALDDFWIAAEDTLAMAIDDDGPLRVVSSNAGHWLWVGMLGGGTAGAAADRLTAADMDAGWGLRTLSSDSLAYDPLSYHRGSIWPHDSAFVIDGLARAGRHRAATAMIDGLLIAAEHHGWRLPELYGGYGSDEVDAPVPYPVACSPQAWSAATPLQLLRTLLRIDPDVPGGVVAVGPPVTDATLRVSGIRLGRHRLDLTAVAGRVHAEADPPLRVRHRS